MYKHKLPQFVVAVYNLNISRSNSKTLFFFNILFCNWKTKEKRSKHSVHWLLFSSI